jgi:RNA polymerase sigma-70 factor (ECF subfamily)
MDLSQDAFVKAFRSIRTYKEGLSFYPWFYAILRNTCFSYLRRRKVRKESSLDAARDAGFDVPDRAPGPAASLELKETRSLVLRELRNLDPGHREILLLRHYEDLTYKQIAEILGCPIGTVMSRLYAARRALAARLRPCRDGETEPVTPRPRTHQRSAEGGRR